jgi:hypothetical protein
VIWLDGSDHYVHPWLQQHTAERAAVLQAVRDTILGLPERNRRTEPA